MPDIQAAWRWAVNTCNAVDPYAGYAMDWRREQVRIGNIVYYDCSSFIWYALTQGGGFSLGSSPFATTSMHADLLAAGFTMIPLTAATQPGDICFYDYGGGDRGHTEMVFAGGTGEARTMGAHGSSRPLADQVSINSGYTPNTRWQYIARYSSGFNYQWHNKNIGGWDRTDPEAQENVLKMMSVLAPLGWTINAVAALAGNQYAESAFNPWRWQSDTVNTSSGYGLFQYTPATKYINSSIAAGYNGFQPNYPMGAGGQDDGDAQLLFMHNNVDGGYIRTNAYPLTMQEFRESTLDPGYLALAWLYNYERPLDPTATAAERAAQARWWYQFLVDHPYIDRHSSILMLKQGWRIGRGRRGFE